LGAQVLEKKNIFTPVLVNLYNTILEFSSLHSLLHKKQNKKKFPNFFPGFLLLFLLTSAASAHGIVLSQLATHPGIS
jgi:hypothetical protein